MPPETSRITATLCTKTKLTRSASRTTLPGSTRSWPVRQAINSTRCLCLRVGELGMFHQPVLRSETTAAAPRSNISAIRLHQARLRVVAQVGLKDLVAQAVRGRFVNDGKDHLATLVQVPLHPVRAAGEDLR